MTPEAYARMLKALLPPGKIWRRDQGGIIGRACLAVGDELSRVDARAITLQAEADPREATELLAEYEETLGIVGTGTTAERRARIVARFLLSDRRRPADYKRILAPLLGLAEADVVVIERSRAFAISIGNDREIYRFFIYRDPTLPGTYNVAEVQTLLDQMSDSHTKGHVILSTNFKCDDPNSLCDRDLLGA